MGNLFRSEDMSCIQLFVQTESAQAIVGELGSLGVVEFRDLNDDVQSFKRNFMNEVRRCDEMERQLRFLLTNIKTAKVPVKEIREEEKEVFVHHTTKQIDELAELLSSYESRILELNANEKTLYNNFLELAEMENVLWNARQIFDESVYGMLGSDDKDGDLSDTDDHAPLMQSGGRRAYSDGSRNTSLNGAGYQARPEGFHLNYVAGVVLRSHCLTFERILWRSLRGNLYFRTIEIPNPFILADGTKLEKNVFFIYVQGDPALTKVKKICSSFNVSMYPCPQLQEERMQSLDRVVKEKTDVNEVLGRTTNHKKSILLEVATDIRTWNAMVRKQKAVNETLNKFRMDVTSKVLIAEGWCPTESLGAIQRALNFVESSTGAMIPTVLNVISTDEEPPTYFRTNKFTDAFQIIVEGYGVANYKEVNPTPYTIISFPFLFAVMFGDLGHGFLMFLMALYIVVKEKAFKKFANDEVMGMVYDGRYVILLMGIFSMFTGVIYSDIFGKGLALFPSGWDFVQSENDPGFEYGVQKNFTYVFGIDHAWHGAENSLDFLNSFKMKLSIILGVVQMTFGVILSVFNYLRVDEYVSVFNIFIPQLIFLEAIFGYLVFAIIYKWCLPWDTQSPPSLLTMLINMFLSPGKVPPEEQLYEGQATVQLILLALALLAVPWMLLVRPFWKKHKFAKRSGQVLDSSSDQSNTFDFGEVMIHEAIVTIEYCLGSISNTASYLRLWALSLAHQQLSVVLWDMTVGLTAKMSGSIAAFAMFGSTALWIVLTFAILLGMEGLSAFLHALRLHWVEFNSKYYLAEGRRFMPFALKDILDGVE